MKDSYRYLVLLNHTIYQKKIYEKLEEYNLSLGQPKIFDFLYENDGCIQKEIAFGCQIEPASVTSILLTMEKRGFIYRKNKNNDRRALYVYLTENGREVASKVREIMEEVEKEALKEFTNDEKEILIHLLKKINNNFIK